MATAFSVLYPLVRTHLGDLGADAATPRFQRLSDAQAAHALRMALYEIPDVASQAYSEVSDGSETITPDLPAVTVAAGRRDRALLSMWAAIILVRTRPNNQSVRTPSVSWSRGGQRELLAQLMQRFDQIADEDGYVSIDTPVMAYQERAAREAEALARQSPS